MKVVDAQSFLLRVPIGRTIGDSMQSVTDLEIVGLTLATDEVIAGTGYTITVGHGGTVLQSVIDTLFIDDLIGCDPHDVREIWQRLYFGKAHWIGRSGATTMAQSAVDIALWDIISKAAGKPLWQVLGGARREDIPIYNTHAGWLNYTVEELICEAGQLLEQGYTALKMKVGLDDPREDIRRVAAVRDAVGEDALLMVDANQKWDLMKAGNVMAGLKDFDLAWVEEPLHPDDIRAHRELRASTTIPLALGEHIYTTHAFRDYFEQSAVDIVQVDVCRIGGITPWMEVAALAKAFGLRICPHCGDLMQVHQHLVKAITNSWLLEVIPIWEQGPFEHQVRLREGLCLTPEAPGAATDITKRAFDEFRVG